MGQCQGFNLEHSEHDQDRNQPAVLLPCLFIVYQRQTIGHMHDKAKCDPLGQCYLEKLSKAHLTSLTGHCLKMEQGQSASSFSSW